MTTNYNEIPLVQKAFVGKYDGNIQDCCPSRCQEVYRAQIVTNSPTTTRSHPTDQKGHLTLSIMLEITNAVPKLARICPTMSHNLHCFKTASPSGTPQFGHKSGRPEISLRHSGHEIKSIAVTSPSVMSGKI